MNDIIYNFYDFDGYIGIISYLILTGIIGGATVNVCIKMIRFLRNLNISAYKLDAMLAVIACVIPLIICIFFTMNSFKLTKMYYLYSTDKCSIITGNMSEINAIRNDYRGNEEYEISFRIGNTEFSENNIKCSRKMLSELIKVEGSEVTVFYTKTKTGYFIHSIQKSGPC